MLNSIDIALTYAAEFIMFGSFAYLSIAFIMYAWQAETAKAQNAATSALPVPSLIGVPQIAAKTGDDDTGAKASKEATVNVPLPGLAARYEEGSLPAPLAIPSTACMFHRSSALHITQPSLAISDDGQETGGVHTGSSSNLNAVEGCSANASNGSDDDAGAETSKEVAANVPLTIDRTSLTIWTRRGEQVAKAASIPVAIPDHIQRLRWRKTDVIRLTDLAQIAVIV